MKNNYIIGIDNLSDSKVNRLAVELAHITALFSDSMVLPNINLMDSINIDCRILYLRSSDKFGITSNDTGYVIFVDKDTPIEDMVEGILKEVFNVSGDSLSDEKNRKESVSNLSVTDFYGSGELKVEDRNFVLNSNNYRVNDDGPDSLEKLQALGAVLARLALDCQSIHFPVFQKEENADILVRSSDETSIKAQDGKLIVSFSPESMEDICDLMKIGEINRLKKYFDDTDNLKNIDGQYIFASAGSSEYDEIYIDRISDEKLKKLKFHGDKKIKSYKDENLIFSDSKTFVWEVDEIRNKLFKELETLEIKEPLKIEVCVSEDRIIRDELKKEILNKMSGLSIRGEVRVINSYKQGYSWIADYITEELKNKNIDEIKIHFSEYSKTPGQPWTDESGSVPSYVNMDLDNEGKWFDMPIRLLQELYPIDDYLSEKLGIERDDITFHLLENDGDFRYRLEAYKDSVLIEEFEYKPVFSERHYLDEFPTMGLVHPSTSFFRISSMGKEVAFEKNETDLEKIWTYYQNTILPKVKENFKEFHEPIFSTLRMDIKVSETDYKPGFRQDIISSIDSFHEDLYFVGLDYFKLISREKFNKILDGPGLILPVISNEQGPAEITWSLSLPADRKPFYLLNNEKHYLENKAVEGTRKRKTEISSITADSGKISINFNTDGYKKEEILLLKDIMESGAGDLSEIYSHFNKFNFILINEGKKEEISVNLPGEKKCEGAENLEVKLDEIYSYGDYWKTMEFLKKTPGITIDDLTRSYQGRMLHAMEIKKEGNGDNGFVTPYKLTNIKPTVYINARHHANEVSSTNSAFLLAKLLLTDEKYRKYPEKMNIVILAMENPDGTEIHHELQKDHPEWIYHISRFNSLGKEFSQEYFKEETIHTEAKALPMIYKKWLPDVYIDDHGVPHHEWCQQFSGYTAPAYKGFWLPRALLYGYFWYREEYKDNYDYAKHFEKAIAESFEDDEDSRLLNKDLRDRFRKYANSWMPEMFPADYYKDLIFYWIPFNRESQKKYLSVMFPEITTIGYTSEVADETATSDYLKKSVMAHLRNNIAMLDLVYEKEVEFERVMDRKDGFIKIKNIRKRV